jgi:hypothetical protein
LVFAQPGTRVIEIIPTGRYNATLYPEKSRVFGLHHQAILAQHLKHKKQLLVELDDITAALSRAEGHTRHFAAA